MLYYKALCTNTSIPHIAIYHMQFNWNKDKLCKKKQPNIWEKAAKSLRVCLQYKLRVGKFPCISKRSQQTFKKDNIVKAFFVLFKILFKAIWFISQLPHQNYIKIILLSMFSIMQN